MVTSSSLQARTGEERNTAAAWNVSTPPTPRRNASRSGGSGFLAER